MEYKDEINTHAWLNICSWSFLIPCSTLIWVHTKTLQPSHPYPHMVMTGVSGVVLAIAGFAFGINKFNTLTRDDVSTFRKAHAIIGTIAASGMMLQILLFGLMKKPWVRGEPWSTGQSFVQHSHSYLGWIWIAFGLVACETGTHLTNDKKYVGGFIGAILLTVAVTTLVVTLHVQSGRDIVAPEPLEEDKNDVEIPPAGAFEIGMVDLEDENADPLEAVQGHHNLPILEVEE